MPYQLINYPNLPEDTFRAALALYGKGNTYIRLGNHLDNFLIDLIPLEMNQSNSSYESVETIVHCFLLTIIQYIEELSNHQMSEALRSRVDLKYAFHLPMNYPSFDPKILCDFRRKLMTDSLTQQTFQKLLDRFLEYGLFSPKQHLPIDAHQLLANVCSINRIDELVDAMYWVFETLAMTDPDWLRQNTIPYWYDRYNQKRRLASISFYDQKWSAWVIQIGEDIHYLLEQIEKTHNQKLAALQEILILKQLWEEQFVVSSKENGNSQFFEWRFSKCASCNSYCNSREVQ